MDNEKTIKIEKRWQKVQKILGFTNDEMALFRSNPKNVKAMEESPLFATHIMAIEVTEARNCSAGYKPGDTFYVDTEGCLIASESPARICVGALWALKPLVDRMWEAFFHNTTEVLHDTVRCPDVGLHHGGTGEITMRIRAIPRDKTDSKERVSEARVSEERVSK